MEKKFVGNAQELFDFIRSYDICTIHNIKEEDYVGYINAYTKNFRLEHLKFYDKIAYETKGIGDLAHMDSISLCGSKFEYNYQDFGILAAGVLKSDKIINGVSMQLYK